MNKIVQRIVTLLLVLLLTCGMFPAVFAADAAPEDTEETQSTEAAVDPIDTVTEPTEPTESTNPIEEDSEQAADSLEEVVTAAPIYFNTSDAAETPMLLATGDGIMLAAATEVTGTHYHRGIIWLTANEKISFSYKGTDYNVNHLYVHGVAVDGKRYVAYCIDPGVDTTQSSGGYTGSETAWTDLDINTQTAVGLAILYGAPNKLTSTDKKTMLTYELATQMIVHEIVLGYRSNFPPYTCTDSRLIDRMTYGGSGYFREITSQTADYSSISGKYMDKTVLREAYDTISASLASHYVLPSFASRYNAAAKTYEMTKQSDGSYAITLTDTNGVLANCTFTNGNGLTYSVSGDKLTITASTAFDGTKSCALSGGVGVSKQVPNLESETFLLWQSGSYQRVVTLQEPLNDPMPMYFNVKVSNPNGTAKIIKAATNGGNLDGWTFEIKDSTGKVIGSYTTDTTGVIAVELPAGTYTVTETSAAKDYWINDAATSKTVTVNAGETASVTFTNQYVGRVKITKALADPNNGDVSGWTFTIYSGDTVDVSALVATVTTGEDGSILQDLQPGIYTITEQIPEDSLFYCTDANPQTVTVTAGETASVTFTNAVKQGKLSILKVDTTGTPRAGAELLLEWSEDNISWRAVTYSDSPYAVKGGCTSAGLTDGKLVSGEDGMVCFDGLHPEVFYRLTETKAPGGLQLLADYAYEGTLPIENDLTVSLMVVNVPVFTLPKTGSNTAVLLPVSIAVYLAACVGVLVYLRRKEQ